MRKLIYFLIVLLTIFLIWFALIYFFSGGKDSSYMPTYSYMPDTPALYEGQLYVTKKLIYTTLTEDDFNFLLKIRNDEEAMKEMLLAGRLIPFAPGARFYVMVPNTAQGYVKIRPEGSLMELYTHRKFLE